MNASGERTKSLWMQVEVAPHAPRLEGQLRCDTVVVGAGIAGLSAAYELSRTGRKVIVIDRGPLAGGMTARTTAHLAPVCDDLLSGLIDRRGDDTARLFQQSQAAAVDRIEEIVKLHDMSCNFRRLDGYLFPATGMEMKDARDQLDREYDAGRLAGAAVDKVIGVPFAGFETAPALRYPNQATFHPLKYLQGLVAAIENAGGMLFADSPVASIEERDGSVHVATEHGATVVAADAIVATNSPINTLAELHSKMAPYRTYAMAFTIPRDMLPDALYWDMADPYHYVRLNPGPGTTDYLIVGGADHKSGEANDGDVRFEAIEAWIRQLVPDLGREVYRWSGQVMDTMDYCGLIGRSPNTSHTYVVTGDSGQGMTHGALAGLLIRDLIDGKDNPWRDVYEPSRKMPKGILTYVSENLTALKGLAEHVTPGEVGAIEELQPGEGGIVSQGESKVAAYRDDTGKLHLRSAACTHLGCVVQWNSTERCWDCPCHGSHFAPDGDVLNAPAITPLSEATLSERKAEKTSS